ncbi:MAG: tetratricopeptide repeat protein [Pirellulales bacterium]|nr:tetratricopeptide repeat protein [Pirellulales bacterium]
MLLLAVLSLCSATTATAQFGPATTEEPSGFKKFTSSVSNGFKTTFSKKDKKKRKETKPAADEHDPLALANKPQNIDAGFYVALARLQEQAGALDTAAEQYRNALKEDKKHLPALMGLAHIYERKHQQDKALELYERAAKSHPTEAAVFNDMGLCYCQIGKLDEAIRAQQKAVSLQPGRKLYRNNLATTLARAGRAPEALNELLAVHRPPTAHYNIGYLLNEQGDHAAARFHFQRALELDPSFEPARQWLAVLAPPASAPQQAPLLTGPGQAAPALPVAPPGTEARVAARPERPDASATNAAASRAMPNVQPVTPALPLPPEQTTGARRGPGLPTNRVHRATSSQPANVPPAQRSVENGRPELPRIVSAAPVVVPQHDSRGGDAPTSPNLPQWSQVPGEFAGGTGASAGQHRPATTALNPAERVTARAPQAMLIQNSSALDDPAAPADAPLPTSTARRPTEYRAPSRY